MENAIEFGTAHGQLEPSPIRSGWVLEGNPVTRNKFLSRSADGTASTYIWDCTAGKFNWYYDTDETICVLDGSVLVKDHRGSARRLGTGDTAFFPAGCSAEWTVENYIRKVAFLREPLAREMILAKRVYRAVHRILTGGGLRNRGKNMVPAGF